MSQELTSLLKLINSGVEAIEKSLDGSSLSPLNEPSVPSALNDPKFMQSAGLVIAAASRLIAALQNPAMTLMQTTSGMYTTTIMYAVVETNVTEALREAGPQGLHVRDLAQKVGMDPTKLGRCLRYLCVRHIYREISPDVFTNNRVSIMLDTGKPFDQVKARGPHRYENAAGVGVAIGQNASCLRAIPALANVLLNPNKELGPSQAAFMQAVRYDGGFFDWLEQPGNEDQLHRSSETMKSLAKMFPKEHILTNYDWPSLPAGSLVVDVGGGVGGYVQVLARKFPDLRFVVQDRPPVIADAEKLWKTEYPEALDSKMVQLQGHDFFEPQPIKDATLFFIRSTIHDWPDAEAKKILQNIRGAATPSTKLLLMEQILPYACPVEEEGVFDIPGAVGPKVPDVFEGNLGLAVELPFFADIHMLSCFNAQERTVGQWVELLTACGWKLESIRRGHMPSLICTPA